MATSTQRRRSSGRAAPLVKTHISNPVKDLRQRFGLSQALLARIMDVSLRTLSAAESAAEVPPQMRRSFTQAQRLCAALAEAMTPTYVGAWLDQPNDLLGELKPIERIERGQGDLVWQVVEGLRTGSQL